MNTSNALELNTRAGGQSGATIDELYQQTALFKTVGELVRLYQSSLNAKAYFVARTLLDAIINKEIQTIKQIIGRIDGGVPDAQKRKHYANIFGDALEDVLAYPDIEMMALQPEDYVIIAMAKVVVWVSMSDPGNNAQKRKDKQDAIQIILERTGGRKSEPTKQLTTTNYVNPEWMNSLPSS